MKMEPSVVGCPHFILHEIMLYSNYTAMGKKSSEIEEPNVYKNTKMLHGAYTFEMQTYLTSFKT